MSRKTIYVSHSNESLSLWCRVWNDKVTDSVVGVKDMYFIRYPEPQRFFNSIFRSGLSIQSRLHFDNLFEAD